MNLIFRLLCVVVATLWRPHLGMADRSLLRFRVWPLDTDLNLHLNNARYPALMDLGRVDFILRSGAWRLMRRERMGIVLGGMALRFRRPLAPFERFSLTTRLLGWDEKWLYVEQVFTGPKGVACVAVARNAFVKTGKAVPPVEVFAKAGLRQASPALPAWVQQWAEVESAFAG